MVTNVRMNFIFIFKNLNHPSITLAILLGLDKKKKLNFKKKNSTEI